MKKFLLPKQVLFFLFLTFCSLITKAQIFTENFDGGVFPPTGWLNEHTAGDNPDSIWASATTGAFGGNDENFEDLFVDPHAGTGMASFRAYNFTYGEAAALTSPAVDLSTPGTKIVSFWMYRDNGYDTHHDSISVYINTTTGVGGATLLGIIHRYIGDAPFVLSGPGWYQYSFTIPGGFNTATNYFIFEAVSDFGNNMFIDDVMVEDFVGCSGTPPVGTAGATAELICGPTTVDFIVSGIPNQSGIEYQWQSSPAGANTFTDIVGANSSSYSELVSSSTDYQVKVTCTNGGAFSISTIVTVTLGALPANDDICNAVSLALDGPADCGNTTCASAGAEADDPDVTCSQPNNTVWYKYTPAADGPIIIVIKRPAGGAPDYMDTWVDIFTATGTCPALTLSLFGTSCDLVANLSSDDSVLLVSPALTAGTDYYFRLDGVAGDFGAYCISLQSPPAVPSSCTNNLSPANGATAVLSGVAFSWNSVQDATGYDVYLGTTDPPIVPDDLVGNIPDTVGVLTGFFLQPSTTYYWYVVPTNAGGAAVGCEGNRTSFTTAAGPANTTCDNAQNLIVSNGFCGNPVLGTNMFADSTDGLGGASCSGSALPNDVWYYVTVPPTGNVTIQTSAVNTEVVDLAIEAYAGTCGTFTPISSIGCDDDGNPDDFGPSEFHSKLGLVGLTPGETIYIRVMPYNNTNEGSFAICAFDTTPSVRPVVSPGISTNTCTDAIAVDIDSAYKYTWATLRDANGDVIAQVYPNGSILGRTEASFYLNGLAVRQSGGIYYLDRNITITPTTQPTGEVLTSLFFKEAELNALAAVSGGATSADLNSTKTSQTCATSATVGTGGTFFTQSGSGDYEADRYVDVIHDSYSTFYLHKGGTALPVNLVSFTVQRTGRANKATWTTAQEINTSYFVIEHSTDGSHFSSIGQVTATGSSGANVNYSYVDYTPAMGINFYRLRIVDNSGNFKYSAVRSVRNEGTADVSVYPNPVRDNMLVNVTSDRADKASITISDMNGRIVYIHNTSINAGMNYINISTAKMSAGTYVIKVQLEEDYVVKKVNKL